MSIATQITRISTAKEDLRTALNDRGAGITTSDSISNYAASATTLMDGFVNQTQGIVSNETSIPQDKYKGYTNLVTAVFTSGVTSIGDNAFSGCTNLKTIDLSSSNMNSSSVGSNAFQGIDENYEIIVKDSKISSWTGTYITHTTTKNKRYVELYRKDPNDSNVYEIYQRKGWNNGAISARAFANLSSSYEWKAVILSGITTIGSGTFSGCTSLKEVVGGDNLTDIVGFAFDGCSSLSSITLSNSLASIGDGVENIGTNAFRGCSNLALLDFGNTRTQIPTLQNVSAFSGMPNNYQIVVPDALVDNWKVATNWSDVSSHIVSYSEYYQIPIPIDYEDEYKKLIERTATKIDVPSGTTIIGGNIFYTCSGVTEINIPNTVETIGPYAIDRCYSLSKIYIPTSVNLIQTCAFRNCSGLTVINFGNQRDSIPSASTSSGDLFLNAGTSFKIVVPNALYNDWIADSYWGGTPRRNQTMRYSSWKNSADYDARIDIVEDNPVLVNQNNDTPPDSGGGGPVDEPGDFD